MSKIVESLKRLKNIVNNIWVRLGQPDITPDEELPGDLKRSLENLDEYANKVFGKDGNSKGYSEMNVEKVEINHGKAKNEADLKAKQQIKEQERTI